MMLVVATSILGIPTLLTAEPNLPLYTAADTICDLLSDASDPVRAQYARLLAQNIPVSTPIDYGQEDRANLFQENSPLRCVLITQGGLLRQLCHSYSHLSAFIKKVRLASNDESQQGGKAGFTVISVPTPHQSLLFTSTPPGRILLGLCGRQRSSSAPAPPTYFTTSAPTVRDDLLNVQADGRLAAHLRETPAPHIMEEDAEPNEDLTGNDFTYSHDTTIAFQELLSNIDSHTKELPNVLSTKHYAALTQLPLTYPWARLVLDLKELLISFDRHLITCLIANQVQGNATPHPGNVLSSFLHHLAQEILLIIAPPGTDDAPPFLHHPEIYGTEFWHAHLNYACTRFAISHGSDRLLGNQICHWTTGSAETCMKVTHLVVFLPPALGAYVLSQHRTKVSSSLSSADDVSMQDEPHTLRINQSSLLTPPAVIKHQAEQIANARRRAAEGSLAPYTIPLLANTQTRSSKNRVTWTLKFTLPTPAEAGTTRRFSAVPRGYGPSGAHALEGAVRYAYPFDYQYEATTLLPDSDFLSLPDHVTQYGPVRAQTLGLHMPPHLLHHLLVLCVPFTLLLLPPVSLSFPPCLHGILLLLRLFINSPRVR